MSLNRPSQDPKQIRAKDEESYGGSWSRKDRIQTYEFINMTITPV